MARQYQLSPGCGKLRFASQRLQPRIVVVLKASSVPSSIRRFIDAECPVRGLDGAYKERPRDATLEASCVPVSLEDIVVPGCRRLFKLPHKQLDQVLQDGGQLVTAVLEPESATARPLAPSKGSYAALCQIVGIQRLSEIAVARVAVLDRVVIQALAGSMQSQTLRCQAAVLTDRWAYFVRAAAVEQALSALAEQASSAACGSEVLEATRNCLDAAAELETCLEDVRVLLQQMLNQSAVSEEDRWQEACDEWDHIIQSSGKTTTSLLSNTPVKSSQASSQLWRLSFAPFAADFTPSLVGVPIFDVANHRRKAMQATDLGLRLEDAAIYCNSIRAVLQARVALRG